MLNQYHAPHAINTDVLNHLDQLSQSLAQAKALAAVAASSEFVDYDNIVINDYMNTLVTIIQVAQMSSEDLRRQLTNNSII